MKSIILSSVVTALLFFSGCSSSEPVVEEETTYQEQTAQEVASVETETVSQENSEVLGEGSAVLGEGSIAGADSNEMNIASLEKELVSVYFDFDKFNIRDDMQGRVSTSSEVAKGVASNFTIKLEGNCDEWGSDEYNFALGLKRANTVKKALVAEGVNTSRITMVSYGESNPTCNDKTKDCWSKNRRVDFKLLP